MYGGTIQQMKCTYKRNERNWGQTVACILVGATSLLTSYVVYRNANITTIKDSPFLIWFITIFLGFLGIGVYIVSLFCTSEKEYTIDCKEETTKK